MSIKSSLKEKVLDDLAELLSHYDFKLKKSKSEFYKKNKEGWYNYQIIFLENSEGFKVYASMGIRKNIVEEIFHRTSGFDKKYQKNTPTIGCFIEDFAKKKKSYRYNLLKEQDISVVIEHLYVDFKDVALHYFRQYDSINIINEIL